MTNPLRAVLVGCGGISNAWLKPLSEMAGVELVGLVDLLEGNAQAQAQKYGLSGVEVSNNLSALLDHTKPDVVFDCTVPEAHMDVTIEALGRGCHVLGETPMADSMANARRMVAVARAAGKTYAVMQNRRYLADIRAVRASLESDVFGPLTTLNCDFYIASHFDGFRNQMRHALLLDMAIHAFDQARFLTGADPVSVYCKEWNPGGSWYAHGASAVAVFPMSNGMVYTYRGSWCAEGKATTLESDWRIIGQHGSILWDGGSNMSAEIAEWKDDSTSEVQPIEIAPYTGTKIGGHAGLIADFVDCIQNGRIPETACMDNIKSLAMVFAAIESADTGLPVPIEIYGDY